MSAFSSKLVVLERNVLLMGLALACLVGGPAAFGAFMLGVLPIGALGFHVAIVGALLSLAVPRRNLRAKRSTADVRVDADGVHVDGRLRVPRAKIADGFFQPRRDDAKYRSSARLVDKLGNVVFEAEVPGEGQALDILRALGLDPTQKRAVFRASSPLFATIGRQLGFVFGSAIAMAIVSSLVVAMGHAPIPFFLFLPLFFLGMWPARIDVGMDGILWRWFSWKKFIPMSDVEAVLRDEERGIQIVRKSGKTEILYAAMRQRYRSSAQSQHRDAVLARIEETLSAYQQRGPAADVSALVRRGTRTKEAWLDALKGLARREGYREAAVREEDLLRVVEDPAAPEDARAGAALVLRSFESDDLKERVRVAANATASPKLRVVLDAAAKADDAAIEEALAEIEAQETAR